MSRMLTFGGGLLFGAMVGAGLVLLLAPQSGMETRLLIQERAQEILEEGRVAAEVRRQELQARFEDLKRPSPQT
jgi:gas vesicle protein